MTDSPTDGRRKRRASHGLARRIGVNITADTAAVLDRLSDTTGYAVGVLAREAIDAGLPMVRDKHRRRAGRASGRDSGQGEL